MNMSKKKNYPIHPYIVYTECSGISDGIVTAHSSGIGKEGESETTTMKTAEVQAGEFKYFICAIMQDVIKIAE